MPGPHPSRLASLAPQHEGKVLSPPLLVAPAQIGWFRGGHAHARVLLPLGLLYAIFSAAALPAAIQHLGCVMLGVDILAQLAGFFIHLSPNKGALGTSVTITGAVLLACAVLLLVYGLIVAP